jgi:hypothetical protein
VLIMVTYVHGPAAVIASCFGPSIGRIEPHRLCRTRMLLSLCSRRTQPPTYQAAPMHVTSGNWNAEVVGWVVGYKMRFHTV